MTLILICSAGKSQADPWFTGPLLAPAGKTIPLGHFNFEPYFFNTEVFAAYNSYGKAIKAPLFMSKQFNPIFSYGLSDWVDAQLSTSYSVNSTQGSSAHHIGDTSILLGFQTLRQVPNTWIPNLRITTQAIIPTGRLDSLNPTDKGTGATGAGAYEAIFSFNFQELLEFSATHALRTRFCLAYLYSFDVRRNETIEFNGEINIKGNVKPGNLASLDLSTEFTLTQHWVAVMEAYYLTHQASTFQGNITYHQEQNLLNLAHPAFNQTSIAPAIEYNFSSHVGIIAGVWFTVEGKSSPNFKSAVIALNWFW